MSRENRVKPAVGVILAVMNVVFTAGCSEKKAESIGDAVPEYNQADLVIATDAREYRNTLPATVSPAAKKEEMKPAHKTAQTNAMQLDSKADFSGITSDTPFGRVIEVMRNSTRPPLNIVVLWNDLRYNSGIDPQTPIGVDVVQGGSIRKNLELVLMSLSTRQTKIDYTFDESVVVIGTKKSLPSNLKLRTYDITDLSSRPADYHTGTTNSGGGR
jgi:hypothetical protein